MQLITMDVEEKLEQKTLPNGLVGNAKTEETGNGQSTITDKKEFINASKENPKALEPVQPVEENCNPIENDKENVVNEDATEVNSKNTNTAILNEKQNRDSAAENKDMESTFQSKQDVKLNNEDTCNNSCEDQKEINSQPTEATKESDTEVSEVLARDVPLQPITCEDNNEDLSSEKQPSTSESEAFNIPKDDAVKALTKSSEVITVSNDTTDSYADKTTADMSSRHEDVITETFVISDGTPKTDEILFDQSEDIVEQMATDIIDAGSTETSKENATSNVDGIALEVNKDDDIEKEDALDTPTTISENVIDSAITISEDAKKTDITKENSKNSDTSIKETVDIATSINNQVNECEADKTIKYSDSNDGDNMETDTSICNNITAATTIKKLGDCSNDDALETDSSIRNETETQDIKIPNIENAMDTTNNDEISIIEATKEGDKKYISLVDEAVVIESTINNNITEVETSEKSEISNSSKDYINMDTKSVENDSIDLAKKSENDVPKECSNNDENVIKALNTNSEIVKNIENIDEDIEEALLASPSHKTDLTDEYGVESNKGMSLENVNIDDNVDCKQVENPAIDITEDSPENVPSAIMKDSDKTDTKSETEVKDNDGIENENEKTVEGVEEKAKTRNRCGLSNTLDILSDDDDDESDVKDKVQPTTESDNKCIAIDDDDDVMLIDEDSSSKDSKSDEPTVAERNEKSENDKNKQGDVSISTEGNKDKDSNQLEPKLPDETDEVIDIPEDMETDKIDISEKPIETEIVSKVQDRRPIVPPNFLKTFKTNVEKMTREELEEFCLLKIVEAVVDRTNLGDIKSRLKTMHQQMEEWTKKSANLSKQNRDLQIVLKTVQEEQKKKTDGPITPLKISRSVGIQVYMPENLAFQNKRKSHPPRIAKYQTPPPTLKQTKPSSPQIPVPRLVPASNNTPVKNVRQSPVQNSTVSSNTVKTGSPMANGLKNSPATKPVEKRPFSSVQAVTVDLTDDEPPPKVAATTRTIPATVRMVPQNQLMARPQFNQNANSPRKVFIPINTPNQPLIRPGQTLMLKSVPPPGPRHRAAGPMVRIPQNSGPRAPRPGNSPRHPAPLPDVPKQQQPPNWKSLPPAPDLKISKVENGIVISWKIDGFTAVNFEEIASYQLYAYQETSAPPNTALWKKIGDVKALPLPMACTLTQFMSGYKYFFAVRAVDVRSRIGPFSLPGSILLLNN